jgi:type 1 fimbria pilin
MDFKFGYLALAAMSLFASSGAQARPVGTIQFFGNVVTESCWNETESSEIACQRADRIERHVIVENMTTSLAAAHATVEKSYLDEDKQLTLLRVVYD